MPTIGLYTATENELGAVQQAAQRLDGIDFVVRSSSDLDDVTDVDAFIDEVESATAVVLWLHGAEDSMPGYDHAVERLSDAGVPLVVKATGDAFALRDTTVSEGDRERAYEYLERGGVVNIENLCRFLAAEYDDFDTTVDDPVSLPTEGVYHPDHPGIEYDELLDTFDSESPTVGIWFYESHWTHANTRYIDALVERLESLGVNVLPAFCNPATDEEGQENAEWVARNWFSDDDGPLVDAVVSSFMFSLSMSERGRDAADEGANAEDVFLTELGVPVLQAITTMRSRSRYESSDTGVMGFELALSVSLPEFDGNVITHPISGKERMEDEAGVGSAPKQHFPIEDRIDHVARLAVNWAKLRYLPNDEKKVAVVLHNYPPSDDGIGTAFGLDSPASTVNLLSELQNRGYTVGDVPTDGQALIDTLTSQLTLDDRWVAPEDVRDLSVDVVSSEQYGEWFEETDERFQDNLVEEWGEPPERPFAIPGVEFENVLVTVQPPRGFGMDPSKVYHDSDLQPPHDYLAFYGWLRNEFDADAVVHLGTHGSLEWLPGKTVGLNAESAPDQLVADLPNVYPYIINNPGEGTQAKRRSYAAIVDYLTPVMRTAGTYDDLSDLEELAREYREAGMDEARPDSGEHLRDLVLEAVDDLDLAVELGFEDPSDIHDPERVDFDVLIERIHEYLTDIKTTQIRMGLHTMSEPPEHDRLVEYLVALTRLPNADTPSLRGSVAGVMGVDYDRMRDEPGTYDDELGMYLSEASDRVYDQCVELVETLAEHDFDVPESEVEADPDDEVNMNLLVVDIDQLGDARAKRGAHDDLREVLAFICEEAAPRVDAAADEIPQTADALNGEYVQPGGSGAPTRGGVDLLPTGRNFYTLDPRKVPAKPAWDVGKRVADGVLERHYDEHEEYPEEFGVVAWGTPTIRTRGETIAQVLAFMGVEPVWTDAGRIDDVEPVPLDELGRPRVDVTTRVSGLFRDAFPQAASVINDAVDAVVELDEPHDMNYVKKHVEEEAEELEDDGVDASDAEKLAKHRVFTTTPGGYGAGTNKAVDEGNWDDRSDLADVYVQWGGYALGSRGRVTEAHEAFERRLSGVEATVKIEDTAEQDEFDSSDWYAFHGGFVSAVGEISGSDPASYVGDSSDPDNVQIYTNEEKVRKTMRARVLNPDWLDSMEEHGYKGAGDLSTTVDVALGWDATTGVVSDALWEQLAEAYAFDEDRQEWMRDVNPWALESITATFLEAIDRGLWDASDDVSEQLQDINLSVEGDLESNTTNAVTQTHTQTQND
ncbi:cobaltochelatase subunit CobN (plasmid) [Haloferax mediterranei ATCC 33500]|uniref:Cobalamin biosynthesis protein / cobaltochelatase CobN n=2 Tax=Haloferacaceae TaxID=1644056 RepID=I3R9I1_HALMT|nr:cobaltochelatase subunit CobN [Haloferax mediterranei]AFK20891.1 cobalamin biosynthesis protein / cobaltochelatase CobN [Haloferax mediterranei ATCC 33500]AHZ24240.1 cobalt chelatase [Haloferax mediterranei ATCC 33500]EMA05319.1 cobalamin biosynthesis protein / cobaltochelatase CobN [Haloferax mediterranei ATCC 33500]QCQ77320.1 cobaltochelatase subunit CobN [Haloferax mediterranei ATCC 33500]